ncbi:MAG: hypothetical protein ACLPTM_00170, partial [Steroidobacteraceae bacterium]
MKNYRAAFVAALVVNVALLGVVVGFWWHSRAPLPAVSAGSQGSGAPMAAVPSATPGQAELPMVPIQISAQRLQSIGVKTDEIQRRFVEDHIFTTGDVAVDETKLAYVQLRFSGYVQKVFVDA